MLLYDCEVWIYCSRVKVGGCNLWILFVVVKRLEEEVKRDKLAGQLVKVQSRPGRVTRFARHVTAVTSLFEYVEHKAHHPKAA